MKAVASFFSNRGGVVYTSPTNKATKVLRKTLGQSGSSCKTIYSLLGIKMVAETEFLTLEFPKKPVDIGIWNLIVVDESSMLSADLVEYIGEQTQRFGAKFLFVGDPAQLPPVGEKESPVWALPGKSYILEQVMRFDNELLNLATHIRQQVQNFPNVKLSMGASHSRVTTEGIWKLNREAWIRNLRAAAMVGLFSEVDNTKAIAWRNKTVRALNQTIRRVIHGDEAMHSNWLVGDRILVMEPVQLGSVIVANIDDEGTIVERHVAPHSYYPHLITYHVTIQFDEGSSLKLSLIHEDSDPELQIMLANLAEIARKEPHHWRSFWGLRNTFHRIRYGFALTAHRSQGSTFNTVFLDTTDVLCNTDEFEGLRCLYVGATRASQRLILL